MTTTPKTKITREDFFASDIGFTCLQLARRSNHFARICKMNRGPKHLVRHMRARMREDALEAVRYARSAAARRA